MHFLVTKLLFFLSFTWVLWFLSCAEHSSSVRGANYSATERESCNTSHQDSETVALGELEHITSENVSHYKLFGSCGRNNSEVRVLIEGRVLDNFPICNKGEWEISIDISGIVNQKSQVQIGVSESSSGGLLCKSVRNYFLCPENYIGVPRLSPYTHTAFCAMKYEAKYGKRRSSSFNNLNRRREHRQDRDRRGDTNRYQDPYSDNMRASSLEKGKPITRKNSTEANKYCLENGAGYKLMSNNEWQTIARFIEQEGINWSEGIEDIEDGNYLNIGNTLGVKTTSDEQDVDDKSWSLSKRTHKLLNGEYIWDFSGNLFEVVLHNIARLPTTYNGYIYTLPSQLKDLFGPDRDYSGYSDRERTRGYGRLGYAIADSFGGAILRGGNNNRTAGIFSVDTTQSQDRLSFRSNVGFRCVYHP